MELIKQHESYRMTDTFDNGWNVSGTVNKEESGNISMWCSVSNEEVSICNLNYTKPVSGNVNVNYDVAENLRDEFVTHTDNLIEEVLSKLA